MRDEMIEIEEPAVYNDFVRDLKRKLLAGELGGDRRDMWEEVRKNRLGLVEKGQSESSEVGEEEAKEVSPRPSFLPRSHVLLVKARTNPLIPGCLPI